MSLLSSVFEPSPSINYNFIVGAYAVASLLAVVLAVSSLVFHVESVQGWYLTMLPFPPCLIWSLVVRQRWLASQEKAKTE